MKMHYGCGCNAFLFNPERLLCRVLKMIINRALRQSLYTPPPTFHDKIINIKGCVKSFITDSKFLQPAVPVLMHALEKKKVQYL